MKDESVRSRNRAIALTIACATLALAVAVLLSGCSGKYSIDYGDQKDSYRNPPVSANPGDHVTLLCTTDVTDATMSFTVDGSPVSAEYENGNGYIIRFTMPDHDVTVRYHAVGNPGGGA